MAVDSVIAERCLKAELQMLVIKSEAMTRAINALETLQFIEVSLEEKRRWVSHGLEKDRSSIHDLMAAYTVPPGRLLKSGRKRRPSATQVLTYRLRIMEKEADDG